METISLKTLILLLFLMLIVLLVLYKIRHVPKPISWIECYDYYPLKDTMVKSDYPDKNYGSNYNVAFGKAGIPIVPYIYHTLIYWNISVPQDAEYYNSSIKVWRRTHHKGINQTWSVGRILEDWDEMTVTWNTRPSFEIVGNVSFEETGRTKICYGQTGYEEVGQLNVDGIVQNMLIDGKISDMGWKNVFSKEGGCPPVLTVCYSFI